MQKPIFIYKSLTLTNLISSIYYNVDEFRFLRNYLLINEEIIEGCTKGKPKAQRALYEFCYPILARVGHRYAKNDDEIQEIINETFVNLINKIDRFRTLSMSPEAYVWRAGVNKAIDLFRKTKSYKTTIQLNADLPVDWKEQEGSTENYFDKEMDVKEIMQSISSLPDMTREVLNLFAIDGYSHKEIGEMLGIKETLSRWHLHKGRKLMYEKLRQKEII